MKRVSAQRRVHTEGRILYFALLPLFLMTDGVSRAISGSRNNLAPSTRRTWFAEAKSQASIATSYALIARSMLH